MTADQRNESFASRDDGLRANDPLVPAERAGGPRTARMRDVAEHAGVALSTVSAFINKTAPVGGVASTRIRQAIDELGFSPNPFARSLARGAGSAEEIFVVIRTTPGGRIAAEAYRSLADATHAVAQEDGTGVELISVTLT